MNVVQAEKLDEPHILLVDKDPITLEQIAALLERRGYLVTCSTNGFDAIMLLKESPQAFDVLLGDHSIPGMNGMESAITTSSLSDETPFFLNIDLNYFINKNRLSQTGTTDIADNHFNIDELDSVIKRVIN